MSFSGKANTTLACKDYLLLEEPRSILIRQPSFLVTFSLNETMITTIIIIVYILLLFYTNHELCFSRSVVSDSLRPHGLQSARLLSPWGFHSPGKKTSGLPCPSPGNLPHPGIKPRSPASLEDSLPSEPPEKPKDTEVDSLSLLQGSFPTQELNRGRRQWHPTPVLLPGKSHGRRSLVGCNPWGHKSQT